MRREPPEVPGSTGDLWVERRVSSTAATLAATAAGARTARPAPSPGPGIAPSGPPIILDISRLLSRAGRDTPTGIDRVELAYAEHLCAAPVPAGFAASDAFGRFGLVPRRAAIGYVGALGAVWRGAGPAARRDRRLERIASRLRLDAVLRGAGALRTRLATGPDPSIYLLVSHFRLEARRALARLKGCGRTRLVCLIHDLIPIEFPEYAKPGQDRRHRQRIETAAALADAIIVASTAVGDDFRPYLQRAGRSPPVLVAPFGWHLPKPPPVAAVPHLPASSPYFVCVGTIEARKNHLLLLNVWRRLGAELGAAAPRLVLIGQRGWLTQHVVDMLERSPSLHGLVVERNALRDSEMAELIGGACALLQPSFAEGFGFPVVEALALGVPVLCSDLPALRETGGGVPDYLDPLDGNGWHDAILDYAAPRSSRRTVQLQRLARWRPADWQDHFAAVRRLIAQLAEPAEAAR